MEFIADLHLHSHFSRATAKNLDLEHIAHAAMLKGITVVGTGDFTHPGWFHELEEKLEPAEDGLFKLKKEIEADLYRNGRSDGASHGSTTAGTGNIASSGIRTLSSILDSAVPELCKKSVRFTLQCEISSIYKKDGRVRKNHNLIYFPDMASVKSFNEKLDRIGNITSDGRPILGLDCEKLLEIMLETSEDGFMVPAHIWTPWFSMFGSKSGFDSVEECFGTLAHHIFAVETGLSSDLPMNWRIENLDRMSFISSSDAHSPMFMGRNASRFNCPLSYFGMRDALKNSSEGGSYVGTIDMHPEEGKYHYDGHRKCNVCLNPSETASHEGICPECHKPLTLGVLYRVQQLASRPEGYIPDNRHRYETIIPLAEILSEICGTGTKTKKVDGYYTRALTTLGPELDILLKKEIEEIESAGIPLLAESIRRMRDSQIHLTPGFDGEFGRVTLFDPEEIGQLKGDISIFPVSGILKQKQSDPAQNVKRYGQNNVETKEELLPVKKEPAIERSVLLDSKTAGTLNPEQQQAVNSRNRPLLMEAGPGTGKTRTLTEKIASLITSGHVNPESILALTFTNRAAEEMRQRIRKLMADGVTPPSDSMLNVPKDKVLSLSESSAEYGKEVFTSTFHGFCLMVLKEYADQKFSIADDTLRKILITQAIKFVWPEGVKQIPISRMELAISMVKQGNSSDFDILAPCLDLKELSSDLKTVKITMQVLSKYQELLSCYQLIDFDDLMIMVLELLNRDSTLLSKLRGRFEYLFVDEYQDINIGQYKLIKLIAGDGKKLCVIGDPDQSIYGFRGADNRYFKSFVDDYPDTEKIVFKRNYRSTETILEASFQLITNSHHRASTVDNPEVIDMESGQPAAMNSDTQQSKGKTSELKAEGREEHHSKERLFSAIEGDQHVHILEAASEEAQAVMIGKKIEHLIGGISMFSMDAGKADSASKDEYSFSDVAVLYRTKRQSDLLSRVFEKAGIPFQTADRDNIFLQSGIKEIISSLRIVLDMATFHDIELLFDHFKCATGGASRDKLNSWFYSGRVGSGRISVLKDLRSLAEIDKPEGFLKTSLSGAVGLSELPNIGKKIWISILLSAQKLISLYNQTQGASTAELLRLIVDYLELDKPLSSSKSGQQTFELLMREAEKCPDPAVFYENITMKRDIDTVEYGSEKVSLMTMHAAKGLEFKVVFIAGCENGLIPFYRNGEECEDIEEERRLFYVAMTRAQELLYLCHARKRQIYGKSVAVDRSLFLHDIEENLKHYSRTVFKKIEKSDSAQQLELFGS